MGHQTVTHRVLTRINLVLIPAGLVLSGLLFASESHRDSFNQQLLEVAEAKVAERRKLLEHASEMAGITHAFVLNSAWNSPKSHGYPERREKEIMYNGLLKAEGENLGFFIKGIRMRVLGPTEKEKRVLNSEGENLPLWAQALYFDPHFKNAFRDCIASFEEYEHSGRFRRFITEALSGAINLFPACGDLKTLATLENHANI